MQARNLVPKACASLHRVDTRSQNEAKIPFPANISNASATQPCLTQANPAETSTINPPPRACGNARLVVKARKEATVLAQLQTSGCLKLLFPQMREPAKTAVLLNTAGGITGGDKLQQHITAEAGSHLRLTTQAAERIYRSLDQSAGRVDTQLTLGAKARLDWIPQETILFDRSHLSRSLRADMAPDARLLIVEPLVFGRAAMGETLKNAHLTDKLQVTRAGSLIFADQLRFAGDLHQQMQRRAIGGGAGAMLSVLLISTEAECTNLLPKLREMLPQTAGVTLLRPDILFLRALAPDSFLLRRDLIPALTLLNSAALPRTWMI